MRAGSRVSEYPDWAGFECLIWTPEEIDRPADAVRAFILEARYELAAYSTAGDVYVESLSITEPGDKSLSLTVADPLGDLGPCGPSQRTVCGAMRP